MCMHINLDNIIDRIAEMNEQELDRVQAAIDRRRRGSRQSTVLERREHQNGLLQLEGRALQAQEGRRANRKGTVLVLPLPGGR